MDQQGVATGGQTPPDRTLYTPSWVARRLGISAGTACPDDLDTLPRGRPRGTLVVGGPGWDPRPPTTAITARTLQQALDEVLA